MESIQIENAIDAPESESEENNIDIEEKKDNSVTDIATLDIKSRLSLETTKMYEEPHANGISRMNGICDSSERITNTTDLPELQTVETSHLIEHGMGNLP